ncbi:MAG: LytTR family DNA-binding domain-containing protein [Planctomycetaceae bacterium]|nr:LytTR family DNA-binding domain-containing protein [Planctomycetaceae bacterium]
MTNDIHCLIVDDEPLARQSVEHLLSRAAGFAVTLSTGDSRQALTVAQSGVADLIFLDIRMPELDGITFLKQLNEHTLAKDGRPYVVLVTAFDQFALQAFDYEALDYLVKPFSNERFHETLQRARRRLQNRDCPDGRLVRRIDPNTPVIEFKTRGGPMSLQPAEITWIESSGHYVTVYGPQRSHLSRARISEIEQQLQSSGFVRVHRGALVNLAHITRCEACAVHGHQLVLRDGSIVPVSRRRWSQVRDAVARQATNKHRNV